MSASKITANLSLEELQSLVLSRVWIDRPALVTAIYDRFVQLTEGQPRNPQFGTEEFWTTVLGETPSLEGASVPVTLSQESNDRFWKLIDDAQLDSAQTSSSQSDSPQPSTSHSSPHTDSCGQYALDEDSNDRFWNLVDEARMPASPVHSRSAVSRQDSVASSSQSDHQYEFDDDSDDEFWQLVDQHGGADVPDAEELNLEEHLDIGQQYQMEIKRLRTTGTAFDIRFRNLDNVRDLLELVRAAFQEILNRAFNGGEPNDKVGMEIHHPGLDKPILIPFSTQAQITPERIMNTITQILQSHEDFPLDAGAMRIVVTRIKPPSGRGTTRKFRANFDQWFKNHSGHGGCFIQVRNADDMCLARSIVTAIAHAEKNVSEQKKREWKQIREGDDRRHYLQRNRARDLMQQAGLQDHQGACGIAELQCFQDALPNYRIKCWSKESYMALIFDGDNEAQAVLHLYHYNGHFCVISSMTAFFESSYYCEDCDTAYFHRERHMCQKTCRCCLNRQPCQKIGKPIYCPDCRRTFASPQCFDKHLQEVSEEGNKRRKIMSTCHRIRKCQKCDRNIVLGTTHACGLNHCSNCKDFVDPVNHQCYMQKVVEPKKKPKNTPSFIYFDFETSQETECGENDYGKILRHKANCCISLKVCDQCKNAMEQPCEQCGANKLKTFLGGNCLNDFCQYLFSEQNVGCTAVAHNARGFDSQFLLQYLQVQGIKPDIITRGLDIMKLETEGIRVIDSLNFLPMPLSAIPKAFNLQTVKGHFPHFFNTAANWDYEGPLPDAWFYGPGTMKPAARDSFYKWYNEEKKEMENSGGLFNFQEALVTYCKADVLVLAGGCMKFRDSFIEKTNVDPLTSSCTIASACNLVFRKNFLKENTIGIVPDKGYRRHERQSVKAIKFLKWYADHHDLATQDQMIRHARNQGEFRIQNYKVDGQLCSTNGDDLKKVFEFNGCAYHGCPRCFKDRTRTLPNGKTAEEAYEHTVQRRLFIENAGYEVEEIWECDCDRMLRQDPDMKAFFDNVDILEPMDPREAFYGGRTNATKLYHKAEEGETLSYLDVCSLYPWVCKYGFFPIGHPVITTDNFKEINKDSKPYFGLIKCRVLPPRYLLHPLLPLRSGNKLCFPLCKPCVDERNKEECQHSDEERAFTGAWVHAELYKAVELGYKVMEILEVWHYSESAQFGGNEDTGLFTKYINTFLKIKQEASGWPEECQTEEQKQKYISDYKAREGIQLDSGKIEKNGALRQLAKLCLNSFWGKFGQRNNLGQVEFFNEPEPYFSCVCSPENIVSAVRIVGDNLVSVAYKKEDNFTEAMPHTNPVIASFVTCQARLKLYSYIEQLQDRVCYFDTDSVVFRQRQTDVYTPPTGNFLGDMTDELSCFGPGSYISEFVAAGPKAYGMRIYSTTQQKFIEQIKLRGFCLDSTSSNTLNYRSLRKLVKLFIRSGAREELDVVIRRLEKNHDRQIVTKTMKKTFKVVYDKRVLLPNGCTKPYGY